MFCFGKNAYIGARAAQYRLGGSAVIVGCGPIGQLSIRWAAITGQVYLCAIGTAVQRLALAREGGANVIVCSSAAEARDSLIDQCGVVPDTIVDTTGHPRVFADVLRLSAQHGRVVLLGDTGSPDQQHLTADLIQKGLTITAGHDNHIPEGVAQPVHQLFFNMIKSRRMNVKSLNTQMFCPLNCSEAYESLNSRRSQTLGVLFDWN